MVSPRSIVGFLKQSVLDIVRCIFAGYGDPVKCSLLEQFGSDASCHDEDHRDKRRLVANIKRNLHQNKRDAKGLCKVHVSGYSDVVHDNKKGYYKNKGYGYGQLPVCKCFFCTSDNSHIKNFGINLTDMVCDGLETTVCIEIVSQ